MSGWVTLGEFAADGAIPVNDRETIREALEEMEDKHLVETREDNGVFKSRITRYFNRKYDRRLRAADSQEERDEIFAQALRDHASTDEDDT